ncbi:MAG TPA: acyl-CoA dehydrogenase family protein [Dehalococcoidia bacterium]|nr:acyl-CoA dehydrogenase family protein [Dehalococcoidia bacterium]
MDFKDSPAEAVWRGEVRSFLQEQLPAELRGGYDYEEDQPARDAAMKVWRERVAQKGWIAPHWPKQYGGADMSVKDQFIMNEEFAEAEAPNVGGFGVMMIGPTLIAHGSEEQKQRFLPPIIRGEVQWCQGYSEPGSGSDLASLQTRAVRDGDDYVINGQKIWTSGAHRTDWMYMLARTDPDAPKHRGISMFLFDMKSPGVTVRPLINMANGHAFNEVFFDNVRVPASQRVGEENRGWYVGATLLDFERSGIGNAVGVRKQLERLLNYVEREKAQLTFDQRKTLRLEFADRWIDAHIGRWISYRVISMQAAGMIPNHEASMGKLFMSEMQQRIAALALHMAGMRGLINDRHSPYAVLGGNAGRRYVGAVSSTIAGGTSEIQRNVIATRGLGLPRG